MKKIILLLVMTLFISGCGKYSENDLVSEVEKRINDGYMLEGELAITNNDDVYNYEVEVSYKKGNYYKVDLTNVSNGHRQVILRNDDGVYIVTPTLNKSYKFQSEWPYNNSQIYLLEALLNDIKEDNNKKFEVKDSYYIFNTKVNYSNNKMLVKQRIIFDKDLDLKEVKIYDDTDKVMMEFNVSDINYSPKYNKDYFELNYIMSNSNDDDVVNTTLDDSIFPLFIPAGTKLVTNDKINTKDGERILMTFNGDKSFLLVEEVAKRKDSFTVIPTYGEPYFLQDTLGVMTDKSLSWTSGGVEYYIVSDVMSQDELIEVAQSISVVPTMK